MSERAWLVEWRFNGVQWLYLWPAAPGGFSFTSDSNSALRFARREDAEAALKWARDTDAMRRPIGSLSRHGLALGEMLVTEHEWCSAPAPTLTAAPQSAQAQSQEPVALQLLRDELPHAEREDKHIHPVGAESFQNWRISIRLPVPLSEADKSPEAALNRLLKGKT